MATKFEELKSLYDGTRVFERACAKRIMSVVEHVFRYVEWPTEKSGAVSGSPAKDLPAYHYGPANDIAATERTIDGTSSFTYDPCALHGLGQARVRVATTLNKLDQCAFITFEVTCILRGDGKWVVCFDQAAWVADEDATPSAEFLEQAFGVLKRLVKEKFPQPIVNP